MGVNASSTQHSTPCFLLESLGISVCMLIQAALVMVLGHPFEPDPSNEHKLDMDHREEENSH